MSETQEKTDTGYQVLARKYRPQSFDDLIGQDALVRTLKNAIESGRIAHAFMLTGIRGIGKTTTARIIAKALNYTGPDGEAEPTTGDTSDCQICQAIAEDRHPDVMEMDAASRTGIDDIREILDGVRYAPTSARYKIYIIDEVHMLSKAAFNALLKTLEEPPAHVKFIFATTEIRKVPITVLSRCQRFDLRRIEAPTLASYYQDIAKREKAALEDQAATMIARAADGSVRDGLSLLDQAIALSDGKVTAENVKNMLGLADRAIVLDLLEHVLKGETEASLKVMDDLYDKGADPSVVIQDMLELSHLLTKYRAVPNYQDNGLMDEGEQGRIKELADLLSMPTLNRTWQILLKGLDDIKRAPNIRAAAEIVLVRLNYAANLPDPAAIVEKLKDSTPSKAPTNNNKAPASNNAGVATAQAAQPTLLDQGQTSPSSAQPTASLALKPETNESDDDQLIGNLSDVVKLLEKNGHMILASQIFMHAHLVALKDGLIELRPTDNAPQRLTQDLSQALKAITGQRWVVTVSTKQGEPTLAELETQVEKELRDRVLQEPLVQQIFEKFPNSNLKSIIKKDETR
ncbi:MAG: DNA polymerase III subunit gamma/tau [Pseudomonadota bacterium]